MSKIYVVASCSGMYEDYREWEEKAFTNREDAVKFAKELDYYHEHLKPDFVDDNFDNVYDDASWEAPEFNPSFKYQDDPDKWVAERDKYNEKCMEFILSYMKERGYPKLTMEMLKEYDDYDTFRYEVFHPCIIKEVELA